ncbi:glycoside hydrolase family 5 protein [Atractiella rhizophila]|nr:glycoside hydrolase family 5 protein [Atractiella rhizophila]
MMKRLVILGLTLVNFAASAAVAGRAVPAWTPPLSTQGRWIVDANGQRFTLKSGNWHGASGTWAGSGDQNDDANHHAHENSHNMPLGLQYVPISRILDDFESLGINSIRLPFSNEMIHSTTIVQDSWVAANPVLKGKTYLQVYDYVIEQLTARGFAVILNNHTNLAKWCCGTADGNERWNESQSDKAWQDDWVFMVNRYKSNARVVGADLYNEVRRDIFDDPNWGLNDAHDWYTASGTAANRILNEANPNILIIIEGINWVGIPVDFLYHHRPTLEPVKDKWHTLAKANKLVYSAHFYGYTGPSHSGATGIGETHDWRYEEYSHDDLFQVLTDQAGYVSLNEGQPYTAPVWISEFGAGRDGSADRTKTWFANMVDYMVTKQIGFAYWPLVGYLGTQNSNGWALLNYDPSTGALNTGADWRTDAWSRLKNM